MIENENTLANNGDADLPDNCQVAHCPDSNICSESCAEMSDTQSDNLKNFVLVEFKSNKREMFLNYKNIPLCKDESVVITAEAGFDLGKVIHVFMSTEDALLRKYRRAVSKTVVRKATDEDLENAYINRSEEEDITDKARIVVQSYGLDLKIIDVEWQFDRHKLTIFFTAPQRVDFRELVKDLARQFKTRIELRQINTREEIRRNNDSVGVCGLPVCCRAMMLDYSQVTLEQAKKQQISNNVSKLSGNCMRIKCCMAFELDFYEKELAQYPPMNSVIFTDKSTLKLNKIDIIKQEVVLFDTTERRFQTFNKSQLDDLLKDAKVTPPATMETNARKIKVEDEDLILDEEF